MFSEIANVINISLLHYFVLSAILFTIGVAGLFINRRNIITILLCVELILLSININFVAAAMQLDQLEGQIFAIFILTVAAAEAAIGLAILVVYYRNRNTIAVDSVNQLRG